MVKDDGTRSADDSEGDPGSSRASPLTGREVLLKGPVVAPGDAVGRFTIRERIGAGGMGEVFSAHDPELDRLVALKLLHGQVGGTSSESRARFQREAQAMARLNHPNVVSVHEVGMLGEADIGPDAPAVVEALAVFSGALLAAGDMARALELAGRADRAATEHDHGPETQSAARAVHARALFASDPVKACALGGEAGALYENLGASFRRSDFERWLQRSCGAGRAAASAANRR